MLSIPRSIGLLAIAILGAAVFWVYREGGEGKAMGDHSTVTDFARLRGWSTSVPMKTAV
jgi:hypothetical protein